LLGQHNDPIIRGGEITTGSVSRPAAETLMVMVTDSAQRSRYGIELLHLGTSPLLRRQTLNEVSRLVKIHSLFLPVLVRLAADGSMSMT
jgi:hypothetical protein